MADVELVVKLPEKIYKQLIKYGEPLPRGNTLDDTIIKAVANGKQLPKGHGDLKDMDDIYEALEGWHEDTGWIVDAIDEQADTIIEADNEEK